MGEFKKTLVKKYPRQGTGLTPDNIYWKNFKVSCIAWNGGNGDTAVWVYIYIWIYIEALGSINFPFFTVE